MHKVKIFDQVKNIQRPVLKRDFRLNPMGILVLALFLTAGIVWQLIQTPDLETWTLLKIAGGTLAGGVLLFVLPLWGLVLVLIAGFWLNVLAYFSLSYYPLVTMISVGLLVFPSFQIAHHWEKTVILRLGRFRQLKGPGVFLIFPLIDRVDHFVDTRIRATDFSAERTITMDTVPVHVDALAFWMIWDAKKAILEVENYLEAVVLSAQTALRDAIGRYDLSSLLSERERLGKEIQQALDRKTNPWGITILSVEFTDVVIPKELEDAMSKKAQAERERQSRVILAAAEVEIADKFEEAAQKYQNNPTALHLRAMNMVYEGLRQNKSSLMLLPSSALESMNLGTVLGARGLQKIDELYEERSTESESGDKESKE